MANAIELKCGCIHHSMVGYIRKCPGQPSRTLSGRLRPTENADRHAKAVDQKPVFTWQLAEVIP